MRNTVSTIWHHIGITLFIALRSDVYSRDKHGSKPELDRS